MTSYRVDFYDDAKAELNDHFDRIGQWDALFAQRWFEGLLLSLEKLTLFPSAYPVAPEDERYEVTVRCLLYYGPSGKKSGAVYRVLFHVIEPGETNDENESQGFVRVLRVLHGSQKPDDPS